MQELKKKNVKILSEKVLLLLNRGGKNTTFVCHISHSASTLSALLTSLPPFTSRRPCVYVQTHPTCTALSAQVSAGCFCRPRDRWHLLPHWHDGDDWHRRSTDIWPFTWRQGETWTKGTATDCSQPLKESWRTLFCYSHSHVCIVNRKLEPAALHKDEPARLCSKITKSAYRTSKTH